MEVAKGKVNIEDYRLQIGDLVSVQISTTTEQQHDFFNKESSSNSQLMMQNPYLYGYIIKEDGNLELPSLGVIKASGFTLRELESVIKNISDSYFESPVVKLNIINFEITVLGEVNDPGTFKIVDPEVNILYALSLSGDMTQFGNRKKVKVIREPIKAFSPSADGSSSNFSKKPEHFFSRINFDYSERAQLGRASDARIRSR